MKIAIWNVNSIKARLEHVKKWLSDSQVDVLMIQELKGEAFPSEAFEALGYIAVVSSQKAYNGVATLIKKDLTGLDFEVMAERLPGDESDEQARFLDCKINGVRCVNIYLPNGNPVDSEKYPYKLSWMKRLYSYMETLRGAESDVLVAGDYNVIPEDRDCHDPAAWEGDAATLPQTRAIYRSYLYMGYTDAFRVKNEQDQQYSFWDYQRGAYQKNNGIRIDHFLLSPNLVDRMESCVIDAAPRALETPSDHVPVVLTLADEGFV
tara:strand:- start:3652 stop:4443 length:792 start_codon:yes stop_codon:yes gene_type:complete